MPPIAIHCEVLELPALRLPFWQYYGLFQEEPYSFLLESAKESPRQGRCSFLGGRPFLVFRAKRRRGTPPPENAEIMVAEYIEAGGRRRAQPHVTRQAGDPFAALRALLAGWRPIPFAPGESSGEGDSPIFSAKKLGPSPEMPFGGGAVGYWGYESGYCIEELPDRGADDLALPDVYLTFPTIVFSHDHAAGRSLLSVFGFGPDAEGARRGAARKQAETLRRIQAFEEAPPPPEHAVAEDLSRAAVEIKSFFGEATYCQAVESVQRHIAAGDVYQVCLTHRLETPLEGGTAWDLYRILRQINPAPFAGYLHFPEVQVVASSPERFLRLTAEGAAESRPIKGTRPRGDCPASDDRLRRELQSSVKDLAENAMIVDLVRNDFGRVCAYGSVRVPQFAALEVYATVFQLVSTIEGRLAPGRDGLDLLRACFPGGSMTGAPKIKAMKIIDRLEPVKRGIYSGALGYHDFSGALDFSIVIRTLVVKDGRCCFHVGGGIVADSQPAAEYHETMDKARALIRALEILKAEGGQRSAEDGRRKRKSTPNP